MYWPPSLIPRLCRLLPRRRLVPLRRKAIMAELAAAAAAPATSSPPAADPGTAVAGGGEMTPLQKHVAFFDRNKDGRIYPWETFQGFRAIGAGIGLSTVASLFINGFLGPKTRPGKFPSLLFPIYVSNIHKGKHGSDTGVYNEEGRFVPEKFEEIFKKHAHTHHNALTSNELMEMLKANREPKNYSGRFAAWTEWKILYKMCKDKDGLLPKDTIKAVYDGSLFHSMENERASRKKGV